MNPIAVKRSIGINIRDYFGMYLLYEHKTLLYYYVKLLKRYLYKDILINLNKLPIEIKEIIKLEDKKIIELYNKSEYNIFSQYKEKKFSEEEWEDLFFLIDKGHFPINKMQVKEGLCYYNKHTEQKYSTYKDIIKKCNINNRYERLLKMFNV